MAQCRRCIAPTTALNVTLDADGICNLCHTYDQLQEKLTDYRHMQTLLQNRFAEVLGQYSYDALVGLSGGKDSSYVAWRLVKDHNLRLLLFTYDNGYLTDSARKNIDHMVRKLGQDHIFVGPGSELKKAIARASMNRFGVPCIGCTFPGFLAAIKTAVEREIPYIVHGRSPAQMFKELAPGSVDPFLPFLQSNFKARDQQAGLQFIRRMSRTLLQRFKWMFGKELQTRPELEPEVRKLYFVESDQMKLQNIAPEFLGYYLFEPYDENLIKKELERELQWKKPEDDRFMGHDDCCVHAASVFLYTRNYGHPILQPELATLTRMGLISREHSLTRLNQETESRCCNENSMQSLSAITGMSRDELIACSSRSHRRLVLFRKFLAWRNRIFSPILQQPLF